MADDPTTTSASTPAGSPDSSAAPATAGAIAAAGAAAAATPEAAAPEVSAADQAAIDELLKQATFDDPSGVGEGADGAALPDASSFDLPSFQQVMQDSQVSSIELLRDVELN